jgi:proteasome accessory factor A
MPDDVILHDAVLATRQISHEGTGRGVVQLEDGRTRDALDIQQDFLRHAERHLRGRDADTDWVLDSWRFTLDALATKPELLIGGVDWISKRWMLEQFREAEGLDWDDPWLQSLDLEYHNIDPAKGLFFGLTPAKAIGEFNDAARRPDTMSLPPRNSRAQGRGLAVARFLEARAPYVINWDSISIENNAHLAMPDPFETYLERLVDLFGAP